MYVKSVICSIYRTAKYTVLICTQTCANLIEERYRSRVHVTKGEVRNRFLGIDVIGMEAETTYFDLKKSAKTCQS